MKITERMEEVVTELKSVNRYTCEDFRDSKVYSDFIKSICDELAYEIEVINDYIENGKIPNRKVPTSTITIANRTSRPYESANNKSDDPRTLQNK